jgi:hypothetical protein
MSELAKAGLEQLVDVVDTTSKTALIAIDATKDAAAATGIATINVADKTLDVAIDEAEKLRQEYITALRRITTAVAEAVPTA